MIRKILFTLLIFTSYVSYAQSIRDSIFHYNFYTTEPDYTIFPDIKKYGAGIREEQWSMSANGYVRVPPYAVTLYRGKVESKVLYFKVVKEMSTNVTYDSITLELSPGFPFIYVDVEPKYSYTQSASGGQRFRFTSYLSPSFNFHQFGNYKVVCKDCNYASINDSLTVFTNIYNPKIDFGAVKVEKYNQQYNSFIYKEDVSFFSLTNLPAATINSDLVFDAKSRFCFACREYLRRNIMDPNDDPEKAYPDCMYGMQTFGQQYITSSMVKLAIPISGILINGHKGGVVTKLMSSNEAEDNKQIIKLFDLTGKEILPSEVSNIPVIAVYENGSRKLISLVSQ